MESRRKKYKSKKLKITIMVPIILHNSHIHRKLSFRSISISLSSMIQQVSGIIYAVEYFATGGFSLDAELPKNTALFYLASSTHFKMDCFLVLFTGHCLVPVVGKKPVTPSRCGQTSMYTCSTS